MLICNIRPYVKCTPKVIAIQLIITIIINYNFHTKCWLLIIQKIPLLLLVLLSTLSPFSVSLSLFLLIFIINVVIVFVVVGDGGFAVIVISINGIIIIISSSSSNSSSSSSSSTCRGSVVLVIVVVMLLTFLFIYLQHTTKTSITKMLQQTLPIPPREQTNVNEKDNQQTTLKQAKQPQQISRRPLLRA